MYSRIDYISKPIFDEITEVAIGNILYLDHALVSAVRQWRAKITGPAGWRLNNLLLENMEVRKTIEVGIRSYFLVNEGSANGFTV